ncbi:MAG TPA: NADP-dependent oxidoreductase [Caulobacteraceae bacterium]|nr:NADP-dependent oxidoreductase [Caulobacteraceae bacterium]
MTTPMNRVARLASRPVGMVTAENFSFESIPVESPGEGEVLVKVLAISLDPAMRGWMNEGKSYVPPVEIGAVMRAGGAGKVIESNDPAFRPGDYVTGMTGVQEYARLPGKGLHKIDLSFAPLTTYLGVLGMPGMTAYFGLLEVGALKDGETVVVSGASGAVGAVVGQIAKIKGCKVVGIAGGPKKCGYTVSELGFDVCIDYKSEDVKKALREHCPKGIDVYFDNVGGEILDAALANLAFKGRVPICGAISVYNATTPPKGPANYLSLLVNRARMEGFIVFDFAARYGEAARAMGGWIAEGRLKHKEDVVEGGVDAFVTTLNKLFTGENFGKLVLTIANE